MREMRYREGVVRGQSSPPRHPGSSSRSFYPSRRGDDSPRRGRGDEGYSRVVNGGRGIDKEDRGRSYVGPRRIEEKDNFDRGGDRHRRIEKDNVGRDFGSRGERLRDDYDRRDRDRVGVGARRSTSPRRMVKRDNFDGDVNNMGRGSSSRGERLSDYDRRDRDRVGDGARRSTSPRRMVKRDNFDGDVNNMGRDFGSRGERLRDYDRRDRDRFGDGARRSTSPRRMVKRDHFDGDVNTRTRVLSDGGNGRVGDVVGGGSPMLSDYGGSKGRVRDVVGVGSARRFYDQDLRYVESAADKYEQDHILDRPRKLDFDKVKDYKYTGGYDMAGDYDTSRSGGGRDSQAGYSNGFSSMPRSKPVSLDREMEKERTIDPYRWADNIGDSVITRNNLAGLEGGCHLSSGPSRYVNNGTEKQGYFNSPDELGLGKRGRTILEPEKRFLETKDGEYFSQDALKLDNPGIERPVGREIYKDQKEDDILYSRDNRKGSSFFPSISQTNGSVSPASGSFKGKVPAHSSPADIHIPTSKIQLKPGLTYEPIGFNDFGEKSQIVSPRIPGHHSGVLRGGSRSYIELPMDKRGSRSYADVARSEIDSFTTRPRHAEEEYKVHEDSQVDPPFKGNHNRDDLLWDQHHSSTDRSIPDKLYAHRSPTPKRKRDLDVLGPRSPYLYNGSGSYHGYGTMKHKERHTEVVHGERSGVLRRRDSDYPFERIRDSPEMVLVGEDENMGGSSKRRLGQEYIRDDELFSSGAGIKIFTDGSGARKIYNQTDDKMDLVGSSKKLKLSNSGFDVAGRASDDMYEYDYQRPTGRSRFLQLDSSNLRRSDSRDIKERLGPRLHVSQRLGDVKKPSLKDRLGPIPSKKHSGLSWQKDPNSKIISTSQDDLDGSYLDMDAEHLADHIPSSEPSENSEEFKQLVQAAFFKFLKQLNETPVERRKYTKRGKVGNLKCIACHSNFDKFMDTESLVMHAFTSDKVGLRSQHLGLHKALCVLNGWRTVAVPNSVWHCEEIPDTEFEALKEDIIIWPPLMIVRNSAMGNKNPKEQVVLSTEELFAMLRGRGFSNILKVCNGNPAHQGLMAVIFRGTVSGLEEAERLHKNYIEAKHGRTELEQLECSDNGISIEKTPANIENSLYGYFGLAQDLDKLDPHTKKQCVLRSKREIQSIIHDPMGAN